MCGIHKYMHTCVRLSLRTRSCFRDAEGVREAHALYDMYIYAYIRVYLCVWLCVYVYMCVWLCLYRFWRYRRVMFSVKFVFVFE